MEIYISLWSNNFILHRFVPIYNNLLRIYTQKLSKIPWNLIFVIYWALNFTPLLKWTFFSDFYETCNVKSMVHNLLVQQTIPYEFENCEKWLALLIFCVDKKADHLSPPPDLQSESQLFQIYIHLRTTG